MAIDAGSAGLPSGETKVLNWTSPGKETVRGGFTCR